MILQFLRLNNFKNYQTCSLNFNPRFNFLLGDNGNGKTNLLEAISMICYTKSFLQNPELDCVKYNEDTFDIYGELINSSQTKHTVRFTFEKSELKKEINFDNEPVRRFGNFFGTIPLIVLSPGDLKLTAGTPFDKRRNFDILISQVSKLYFEDLKSLSKIIKQKNSLLKDNLNGIKYSDEGVYELLNIWNDKLAEISARIVLKRLEFIKEFEKYIKSSFNKITGDSIVPEIEYISDALCAGTDTDLSEKKITGYYKDALKKKLQAELSRGLSIIGPHRDKYIFSIIKDSEKFELQSFASQGEHKAFVVALKFSEYLYMKEKLYNTSSGEPIILCDDLFSELDANRTEKIAALLSELNQVFLTTTDERYIGITSRYINKNEISSFKIVNGTAEENPRIQ